MKPFNLKEYLANPNKKMVTRDGREVERILCTDAKGPYPIVALVKLYDDITDRALMYTKEGMYLDGQTNGKDLFFKSEKYEGWINLYKNKDGISWISPNYFKSKEEAEEEGKAYTCNVTTIKIEWEE